MDTHSLGRLVVVHNFLLHVSVWRALLAFTYVAYYPIVVACNQLAAVLVQ